MLWQIELEKWGYDAKITSGDRKWAIRLDDRLATMDLHRSKDVSITITTYKTFSTDKFIEKIEKTDVPKLLIADEVHNAGSFTHQHGLSHVYDYRLGLSATLERYFDPDGTKIVNDFFGGTVYSLDLATAIPKFLVEYYYYPIYVDLTDEEYEKYINFTKTIARLWNSKDQEDKLLLELTLNNRSRIIRDAKNKLNKFLEWAKNNDHNIKHLLVYCSEVQIKSVKNILTDSGHPNCEITAKNPKNPADRIPLIEKFSAGLYHAIVANKVLDEGADIPSAKNCILLASTGNPKQFIQRRGRVLRKFNGKYKDGTRKEYAQIYDILVIPKISDSYTEKEIQIEQMIVASQLKRQEAMAKIAINKDFCMQEIEELKRTFKI